MNFKKCIICLLCLVLSINSVYSFGGWGTTPSPPKDVIKTYYVAVPCFSQYYSNTCAAACTQMYLAYYQDVFGAYNSLPDQEYIYNYLCLNYGKPDFGYNMSQRVNDLMYDYTMIYTSFFTDFYYYDNRSDAQYWLEYQVNLSTPAPSIILFDYGYNDDTGHLQFHNVVMAGYKTKNGTTTDVFYNDPWTGFRERLPVNTFYDLMYTGNPELNDGQNYYLYITKNY